jgi:hypothetical protein
LNASIDQPSTPEFADPVVEMLPALDWKNHLRARRPIRDKPQHGHHFADGDLAGRQRRQFFGFWRMAARLSEYLRHLRQERLVVLSLVPHPIAEFGKRLSGSFESIVGDTPPPPFAP